MSINIKKYTKEQMAKMVEEAQAAAKEATERMNELQARVGGLEAQARILKAKNAALTEQLDQMNGEAINKANEIANLKADADALRNKVADTETALGRANADVSHYKSELRAARKEATDAQWAKIDEYRRAEYAEAHPWRNLWAWIKRKFKTA